MRKLWRRQVAQRAGPCQLLLFPIALIVSKINGTRSGAPPINGGANIEMGGPNSNQLVEYVHSFDPRGWSCLHIAEGSLNCNNATVQNNDIGPAGSDLFQQWADGISMACQNSLVRNNMINNPTDGGVVLFGAPGTRVENNTIWVETVSFKSMLSYLPNRNTHRILYSEELTWLMWHPGVVTTGGLWSPTIPLLVGSPLHVPRGRRLRVTITKASSSSKRSHLIFS